MQAAKLPRIVQWWVTPKLPAVHILSTPHYGPNDFRGSIRLYIRKWLVHPIKRRLARSYCLLLQKFYNLTVIGITGSAGKTTTKEMLASILSKDGTTIASIANIDPVYNIPTTILKCLPTTKYLILEMGVEYPGEMDFYLWLARPKIGVITNIYPTHTEFLGDPNGVFREKSKLIKGLGESGTAILSGEDKFLTRLKGRINSAIVWFGDGSGVMSAQVKTTSDFKTQFKLILDQDPQKTINITLPALGFVSNALAASAVAHTLGVSLEKIKMGLENFKPQKHRMEVIKHKSGAIILDDSYNSNPLAAKWTINTLSHFAKREKTVIVFGDMLELGYWEKKYHMELGKYVAKPFVAWSLAKLICIGEASVSTASVASKFLGKSKVSFYHTWEEAKKEAKTYLQKDYVILVKGSRSIGLDNLVSYLVGTN